MSRLLGIRGGSRILQWRVCRRGGGRTQTQCTFPYPGIPHCYEREAIKEQIKQNKQNKRTKYPVLTFLDTDHPLDAGGGVDRTPLDAKWDECDNLIIFFGNRIGQQLRFYVVLFAYCLTFVRHTGVTNKAISEKKNDLCCPYFPTDQPIADIIFVTYGKVTIHFITRS